MPKVPFKLHHPLETRQAEAARIRQKYPDRIPIIVEKAIKGEVSDIENRKYLVPADLTVVQFVYLIRKQIITPDAEKAIFLFVNNMLPPSGSLMSALYDEYKDKDGFLYVSYSTETMFGSSKA